jgi:hypothetical protein
MSRHVALQILIVQRLVGRGNVGRMQLGDVGKCFDGRVVAHDKIEYMGQESGIGGSAAQRFGSDAAFSQERTQPFGIAGDKGKRLNCNDFSYFPRVSRGLSQGANLPFRNLWSLFSKRSCPSLPNVFKQLATTCWKWRLGLTG